MTKRKRLEDYYRECETNVIMIQSKCLVKYIISLEKMVDGLTERIEALEANQKKDD